MSETFSGYAIVEVMGHNRYVGYVEETTLAGAGVLRVDVPEVPGCGPGRPGIRAFTKFIPPSSLYALTPITDEEAEAAIAHLRATPHNLPMIADDSFSEWAASIPYPDMGDDRTESDLGFDEDDEL